MAAHPCQRLVCDVEAQILTEIFTWENSRNLELHTFPFHFRSSGTVAQFLAVLSDVPFSVMFAFFTLALIFMSENSVGVPAFSGLVLISPSFYF